MIMILSMIMLTNDNNEESKPVFFLPRITSFEREMAPQLNKRLRIITKIRDQLKSGIMNASLQDLKKLTNDLVSQLKTIPNYLEQDDNTLMVVKSMPVTSGITLKRTAFPKNKFFGKIQKIETINMQATQQNQFNQIVSLTDAILGYFIE